MTYPPPPEQPTEFPPPPGGQPYYGVQPQPRPPANNSGLWGLTGFAVGVVLTLVVTGFLAPGFFLEKRATTSAPPTSSSAPVTSVTSVAPGAADPGERAPIPRRPNASDEPVTCEYPADQDRPPAKQASPPPGGEVPSFGTTSVTFKTGAGEIELILDRSLAPCAVHSFVSLAKQGFYTGTSCHRLGTEGLQVLQCGDPTGTGTGTPGYSFKDETFPELTYGRGILAMANAGPDTNGSQFFMVYGDAPLDPSYDVIGSISGPGLQVLDKVAQGGVDPASLSQSQDGTGKPKIPVTFAEVVVGP
jgi:peptidyl-prolyl cis-trans isomerase B (cyclophilin B)